MTSSRPQHRGRPGRTPTLLYEDLKPTFRWQEDGENHILTIDLPGFLRKQINVSMENKNIIRVRGERPVGHQNQNRRARFREDFQVPENGDMNNVIAKFDRGSLVITVGKKIVDKPQEAKFPKHDEVEHPSKVEASQPRDEKSVEPASGDSRIKQDLADVPREGRTGTPFRDAGQVIPQDYELKEEHVTEKTAEKKEDTKKSEALPEAQGLGKTELTAVNKASATTAGREDGKESKEKHKIRTDGKYNGVSAMEKLNEAVNELTEVNEEKQSLMNMGAAVFVIMALSAYVTYQFASAKNKN